MNDLVGGRRGRTDARSKIGNEQEFTDYIACSFQRNHEARDTNTLSIQRGLDRSIIPGCAYFFQRFDGTWVTVFKASLAAGGKLEATQTVLPILLAMSTNTVTKMVLAAAISHSRLFQDCC